MKVRFSKKTLFAYEELIEAIGDARNITITQAIFNDRDMNAFQRMADVYLSLHRAEGYGLNIQEMLESGVPTIATGWSGNMDFMPRYPHATAVPFKLVEYADRTHHFQDKGLRWAEADVEAAARSLQQVKSAWDARRRPAVLRSATPAVVSLAVKKVA
jgi:glycosyltransferase involved in cell wall biosynthesis